MEKQKCHCHGFAIIFTAKTEPVIMTVGGHKAVEIKKALGIPEADVLIEVFENERPPKKYADNDIVKIEGCETFMGAPPSACNSDSGLATGVASSPFTKIFGAEPEVFKEAGYDNYLFRQFLIDENGKRVDMLYEWPQRARLLFSEKIPTPKNDKPNWAYPNVMVGGKLWQGISLKTDETEPMKALLSILEAILW